MYRFSVTIHDEQFPNGTLILEREIHASCHAGACYQARHFMFHEVPDMARRGLISETATVNNHFHLEDLSEHA